MANYFNITLDTTGPSSPSISLESGSQYTSATLIDATISTGDATTTSYQMKIWGDIDLSWSQTNGIIEGTATTTLEDDAIWITYSTTKQIQLSSNDESKVVYLKIRDGVHNTSSQTSGSIILDTSIPTVTVSGPDVSTISKQANKNISSFSFQVSEIFVEYKVKIVSSSGSPHDTGTDIGMTNGSTNMSGTGTFSANTPINCTITGTDLELSSAGDGEKGIKVFVKDESGLWSS